MLRKILIFSTAYYPFVGGAEVAVKEITDRIGDFGFDMVTARMDKKLPKFERIGNVDVYRIGFGVPVFDKYYLAFCGHRFAGKLHKNNQYSAVWSIMASYGGFTALSFKKKNPDVPFLLTIQEGDDPEQIKKRVGVFKKRFRNIFVNADYVQCISKFLANWAKENGATSSIEIVPNAVDLNVFKPKSEGSCERAQKIKNDLGILENEKVIISISRLVRKNGLEDLIKAGEYINTPFKILIVGSGPDEEKLKELSVQLKLEDKVTFVGFIEHKDLVNYYYASDVFVRPSLSEGLGNVFLEAMATGLPVIGTPIGGIPDFLKDQITGLFCGVGNPESIAEKIEEILENNALREKIIKNGMQLVQTEYTWDVVSEKMNNIFNKLCES